MHSQPIATISIHSVMDESKTEQQQFLVEETGAELEIATRGQGKNPLWHKARLGRVTASICAKVLKLMTGDYSPKDLCALADKLMEPRPSSPMSTVAAIAWGLEHEATAVEQYCKEKDALLQFEPKGLCTPKDPEYFMLGASPDGIISLGREHRYLLEVKCPYTG
jgi:hypothetical protein